MGLTIFLLNIFCSVMSSIRVDCVCVAPKSGNLYICVPGDCHASHSSFAILSVDVDPVIDNSLSLIMIVLFVNDWNVSLATSVVDVLTPTSGKSNLFVPDCVEIVSALKNALFAGF